MLILGMCQNGWLPSSKVLLPLLVAFSGYESEVTHLLSRIEKNTSVPKQTGQRTPSAIRRQRELRKLEFGVNYDRASASSSGMLVPYI